MFPQDNVNSTFTMKVTQTHYRYSQSITWFLCGSNQHLLVYQRRVLTSTPHPQLTYYTPPPSPPPLTSAQPNELQVHIKS